MKYCWFSALKVTYEVLFSIMMKHDAHLYYVFSNFIAQIQNDLHIYI